MTETTPEFLSDVLSGLGSNPKTLKPKYFYDQRGAELFAQICKTPEYYPTRMETGILKDNAKEISAAIGPGAGLIEYGSGTLEKVKILLDNLVSPSALIPIDISSEQLSLAAASIQSEYPDLPVFPVVADFTKEIKLPISNHLKNRRVGFFPGSTIGNFEPNKAVEFLASVYQTLGKNGSLLIGFDLKKNIETLVSAYDDAEGITAAFNKNILVRINNELQANFNIDAFNHLARYNESNGRVEMHLESLEEQTALINGKLFQFHLGETIHTENCYKFTIEEFKNLAVSSGFHPKRYWTDDQGYFSVMLLQTT